MRIRTAIATALAVSLAAACTMGPNYQPPEIDTPKAFHYEPQDAAQTADTEWWKQFGDSVLDALINEALANNRNVKVAAANVLQAAGVFTQARSQLFPQVGYDATGQRTRTTESGVRPDVASIIPNPVTSDRKSVV